MRGLIDERVAACIHMLLFAASSCCSLHSPVDCRYQRMRAAAKASSSYICRFFKRKIYEKIKENVVTM